MRTAFRAELDELVSTVARMTRGAGQMLTNASIALHQSDAVLAGLVITDRDRMAAIYDKTERRWCRTLLALQAPVAEDAATALEHQDPLSGCRPAVADDELDALLRHLFGVLFDEDWPHGVERAVDAVLLGRYYERFGDHAVAIARQACYLATGQLTAPDDEGMATTPAERWS